MSEELPVINGNPIQLRQMMDNLISNSVKYTPMGGEITVSADKENGQVIIRVADTGPGIPVEDQSRIFEKFYRAKNVEAGIPGTGLGLAITKSIVDNHRGRIWVESEPGKGSTFTVVLPIAQDEPEKIKEKVN
jgi:signal transduction histidine kinase